MSSGHRGVLPVMDWIRGGDHPRAAVTDPVHIGRGEPRLEEPEAEGKLVFVLSSILLRRCLRKLTPGPDEELMLLSGVEVDTLRVPQLGYRPGYEHASLVGVRADPRSTMRVLRHLGAHGHRMLCAFHSHPGRGPGSVRESSTDVAAQKRYERLGYEAITGIFSRDGYVRFFAVGLRFQVRIFGSDVEEVGDHVFRLA